LRGGSWNNNSDNARADNRNRNNPDNRNNNRGFRVVSSVHIASNRHCRNWPTTVCQTQPVSMQWRGCVRSACGYSTGHIQKRGAAWNAFP
jgi:hypothetical protein